MSNYPGNASLSDAVKQRVVSTFQQTLTLYKQGRSDEAVQGCGLILRMDPAFTPAKKLMEKARNPAAPIDVETLMTFPSADPLGDARKAMAARDFEKAIQITTEILTNDLMNEEARLLNEQAREKAEASPFVEQFVKKIDQAIASGNVGAARAGLEKIKSLDGDDTAISRIEQAIRQMKPPQAAASGPAHGSPSFVVDNPPAAAGRGTAQASDFGFTFEEDKKQQSGSALENFSFDSPFSTDTGTVPSITPPAGFSLDTPPAPKKPEAAPQKPQQPSGTPFSFDTPPPSPSPVGGFSFDTPPPQPAMVPGSAQEFDFATASIETSPDDQKKVQEYLTQGDTAFDAGDFQKAIDLWSRVFLIDVTNEQASERIEKAKARRRAIEQDLDGILAAGTEAFDRGDQKTAREKFTQAQQLDPRNPTVHEYLEKLQAPAPAPAAPPPSAAAPKAAAPIDDIFADDFSGGVEPPLVSSSAAPSPSAAAKRSAAGKTKPAASTREFPVRIVGIIAVLAILAAGGYFAWSKFMAKPAYDPAATDSVFRQATTLADKGQYDAAVGLLQDVKVSDPQHDKALSMIADIQNKKAQASANIAERPATAVYQDSLKKGKAAYEVHDYEAAKKAFDAAANVKPLPPDMKAIYDTVSNQVAKLEGAKALFNEQRYQDALANLETLHQADPQNQSITRLMADSHFNLGATALQENRLQDAAQEFGEVLKIDPNDDLARRSKALAERYDGQPRDLLYKIYVKYLPMRRLS